MDESIGSRLQYAMGIRRVSQSELAVRADISTSYISMMCNDIKIPSKKMIARICSVLRISREWLADGYGDMEEETDSVSDIAVITAELLNADPKSLKRIFAMTIAMLSEQQLQVIADAVDEFQRQRRKADI